MSELLGKSTCCTVIMLFNALMGGVCFDYALWSLFGRDIPWWGDMLAGMFTGQFVAPVALVCWVLRLCGVSAPFFHRKRCSGDCLL